MRLLVFLIATALVAQGETPMAVGVATVLNSNDVKASSFDGNWVAGARGDGFGIYTGNGELVYVWSGYAYVRENVTVSWSPDSKRVIILDQQGRAAQFYCAELENGQWHAVDLNADPKMPTLTRVTKATLGSWISPTQIEVHLRHLVDVPPRPEPEWINYTTTLTFGVDGVNFAAK